MPSAALRISLMVLQKLSQHLPSISSMGKFFDQFQWNHSGPIQDFERVLPTLFPNFHACQKVFIALDMKTNVAHKVTSIRLHQNTVIPIDE